MWKKYLSAKFFPFTDRMYQTNPAERVTTAMKKLLHFLLACTGILPSFADDIDIVLIGGQSNATGQAYVRNIPSQFKTDPDVQIYYSKGTNKGQGSEQWKPLCPASESLDRFGVELTLGTELHKLLPNRKIALIKHALSGSNLYQQWNPGNRPGQQRGAEYAKFMETVNKGMAELRKQGHTPTIRAMVWQQGEADAHKRSGMENSNAYSANLANFIAQVRKDTGAPDMLFVYGTVLPKNLPNYPGRDVVREAQRHLSQDAGTPFSIPGAFVVDADNLQMRAEDFRSPLPDDYLHLGTFGIMNLGERMARTIKKHWKQ